MEEADEGKAGSALENMVFAISGAMSIPRKDIQELITSNGGTVVASVTSKCTHLLTSETGTKKCKDAQAKGVIVVSEDWLQQRIASFADEPESPDGEPQPRFTPSQKYVQELISTPEDEGSPANIGLNEKLIGHLIWKYYESTMDDLYKVASVEKKDGGLVTLIKSTKNPDDVQVLKGDDWTYDWKLLPPPHVLDRWERYQSKRITEGVWWSQANPELMNEVNQLVDELAASEPVDHHPGTSNIVRDLVHPSLYPLLIDPNAQDLEKTNYWGRNHEESRFQWLPTEVEVDKAGNAKFVSPINNLDTDKYPALTHALEKVLTALIPGMEKVWQYAQKVSFTAEAPYDEVGDDDDDDEDDDGDDDEAAREASAAKKWVRFAGKKLQAIVKIADYEFAPQASFSGVWHYEGMAHENIVMTGLFYPNSDERLGGGLEFKRQFTDEEGKEMLYGFSQERPPWLDQAVRQGFVPLGWTSTETGRLMVFPNCHAHRVLEMINATDEVLRRRLIVFFIVQPGARIPSSRDFPPMPRKISLEQALADRLELMEERRKAKQDLNPREIELCEH